MLKCVTNRVCEGACPGHSTSDIIVLLRSLLQVQCCFKMCEFNLKWLVYFLHCNNYIVNEILNPCSSFSHMKTIVYYYTILFAGLVKYI